MTLTSTQKEKKSAYQKSDAGRAVHRAAEARYRAKNREKLREDGRLWWREKGRKKHIERKYGISFEDVRAMLAQQDNRCALCPQELSFTKTRGLHIDHCHETGKVRGLLCGNCNMALGHLERVWIDNLDAVSAYAKKVRL